MDARDLFLDQHAALHSAAVGGNKLSAAERTFAGLTDEQMRGRPREDLNSLAWLLWHIARAEDVMVNRLLAGRPQVFERAAAEGAFGPRTEQILKAFPGRPRTFMLSGTALFHSAGHMGEAATVRTAGGFGTGV